MNRIKVVSEAAELVPILRAVDTKVKREVFKEVTENWCTAKDIENKFGEEGLDALKFFEKMNLVETKWQSSENEPEKAYHSFYSSFHIDASSTVHEISDILAAAVMDDEDYEKLEKKIYRFVGEEGKFVGDVAEKVKISQTLLRGLVKRSSRLEYRGHRIERLL
ncbi:MAG: ArsR family transcriptional regulator [Methanobacteriota archaeon]|nr:MAG: ArsR family transcriptional regulator [Euryarchaeota archaeon]